MISYRMVKDRVLFDVEHGLLAVKGEVFRLNKVATEICMTLDTWKSEMAVAVVVSKQFLDVSDEVVREVGEFLRQGVEWGALERRDVV